MQKILKPGYEKAFYITLFIVTVIFLKINSNFTFIGRGDYANYATVARNLVAGKGFTVDFIAQYFIPYESVHHPEDMWPILQPVWMAASFLIFGISQFSARLPNVIFLALLSLASYLIAKKLFNKKVAFWAGILTLLNTNLILYSTELITSDVAFALLSLIIFYLGSLLIIELKNGGANHKKFFLFGILNGLAVLQKPLAIIYLPLYLVIFAIVARKKIRLIFKPVVFSLIGALIFTAPFFIRNLRLFGTFLLPVENYLSYLIKYTPYEAIFSIYYNNLPSFKTVFDGGFINFLKINFTYFRFGIDTFVYKDLLIPYTVIVLSLLGIGILKTKEQKSLFFPPIIFFLIFSAVMTFYWHYESRYYASFIPLANMLAVYALFFFLEKITNSSKVIIVVILALITFLPSVKAIYLGLQPKPIDPSLKAYEWIRDNTPKESVIYGLGPWELHYHSERAALMIPYNGFGDILYMAKKHQVNYLVLEFLKEIKRPVLEDLYTGKETPVFSRVYQDPEKVLIYRINWDKVNLEAYPKPKWF